MNLTIKQQEKSDQSNSFSHYISHDDKYGRFKCQLSQKSDTQLLETSPIRENSSFCISSEESIRRPFILKADKENSQFSDLGTDFQIGLKCLKSNHQVKQSENTFLLQRICHELVLIIKNLQKKLDLVEGNEDSKSKSSLTSTQLYQGTTSSQSTNKSLYSSILKGEVQPNCFGRNNDQFMQVLLQLIEAKGQIKLYNDQNQKIQAQLLEMKVLQQQQLKDLKKSNTECLKLREMLKQYRSYFKNKQENYQEQCTDDLQNSLDMRLKEQSKENRLKKSSRNSYILDSVAKNLSKETPKTPLHFRYRSCHELLNQQKTKARSNNKHPSVLKDILQFQFKAQNGQSSSGQRLNIYNSANKENNKRQTTINDRYFYDRHSFDELLEAGKHQKEEIFDIFKPDFPMTMETLSELPSTISNLTQAKCSREMKKPINKVQLTQLR